MQSQPYLLSRKAASSSSGGNSFSSSIAAAHNKPSHQYFPATATNLLRSIAKRRRSEVAFAARLSLFGEKQSESVATVSSGGSTHSGSTEALRETLKHAILSFEVRTNRWPLEDRLAQTRHSITRFQPTLIRDVSGTPQFDRASYNKGMRCLLRIEEESQLPQPKGGCSRARSWLCEDGDNRLDTLQMGEERQPFKPQGFLSSSTAHLPPQDKEILTEVVGRVEASPPWVTALQYFQQDTIETGRQLSSDVRTRVLNVLTMAARRRHDYYHGNVSGKKRSHPPMALFLRWWVLLTVERDVGISKTASQEGAPSIPFNPFSYNFSNGTALACPWAVEWTPTCKRLLGRHWSQYGAPDDFLFTKTTKRNSDDRALVNELRLQQALPVTLGRDVEGDEDSVGQTPTTFFPRDPALLRELLSTAPLGTVTGNRHANASIIPMLLRYNMWAEALRFAQSQIAESAGFGRRTKVLPDSVSDSLEGAVYEVLTGKRSETDVGVDDAEGFCNPLFAPIHHGNAVAKLIGGDSTPLFDPTPRWAIALELISVLINKQLQDGCDGSSFGVNPVQGSIATVAKIQQNSSNCANPSRHQSDSRQVESAAVFLSENEVEPPSLMENVDEAPSGCQEEIPQRISRSLAPSLPTTDEHQYNPASTSQDYQPLTARPTFTAFATLVSQRFGHRSQDVGMRGGYPWEAALKMCRSLSTLTPPTSRASLELTVLALRLVNAGAGQQLASLSNLGNNRQSILRLCLVQSQAGDNSERIESALRARKQLLAAALSLYGQAPPSHLQSPMLIRQALVAAVEVAIQHLTENLVSAVVKSGGPHENITAVKWDDNERIAGLYEVLDNSQKKSFAHILTLLCGSISERYVLPLQEMGKEGKGCITDSTSKANGVPNELFIPVSVANRIVQMCVAFCPSLRYLSGYDFTNERGIPGMGQVQRLFENSQQLRKSGAAKADIFGDNSGPPEVGHLYLSEKAQRHLQHQCFDLDLVEGVDVFKEVRKLLEFITTSWGNRVTETSAQFIPFAQKILRQSRKVQSKSAATQAFEAAAEKATIPQLKVFAKSLLQSGSWKKALHVSRVIDNRRGNEVSQSRAVPASPTWLVALKNLSEGF